LRKFKPIFATIIDNLQTLAKKAHSENLSVKNGLKPIFARIIYADEESREYILGLQGTQTRLCNIG